jgi:hypothetical protein
MTNQRQHARLDYDNPVEISFEGGRVGGRTVNISRGGVFVAVDPPPEFGARVDLLLDLPGVPDTCSSSNCARSRSGR